MDRGKVYISAPITGYDIEERMRFFSKISGLLTMRGYSPVNPMLNGVDARADEKEHLRADFKLLLDSDYLLLCRGWEDSNECQKEASVALWAGIPQLDRKSVGI